MIQSKTYLYHKQASTISIDLKKFAHEVQQPVYGNLINQFFTAEQIIQKSNIKITNDFESVIRSLRDFIEVLKKS